MDLYSTEDHKHHLQIEAARGLIIPYASGRGGSRGRLVRLVATILMKITLLTANSSAPTAFDPE